MTFDENLTRADVAQLQHRIMAMLQRGTVARVDDAMKMQLLDIDGHHGFKSTKVEHWHPYGISMHPHAGSEVLALALGGNQDHMIIVGTADRRYRLKGLAAGEMAIHDDQNQKVHFERNRLVIKTPKPVLIESDGVVTIKASKVVIQAPVETTSSIVSAGVHQAAGHV